LVLRIDAPTQRSGISNVHPGCDYLTTRDNLPFVFYLALIS
jgi:hypothetical protein